MRPEEIKKLLGGYASGTLTPEEQQALFAAALEDQELFDALAREQALRDLLRDPASRGELLAALDRPTNSAAGLWQWLTRPMVARVAVSAVSLIAIVAVWQSFRKPVPDRYIEVAELHDRELRPSAPVAATPVTPAPLAAPAREVKAKPENRVMNAPASGRFDKAAPPASDLKTVAPVPAAAPPAAAVADLRGQQGAAPALMARKKESAMETPESVVVTSGADTMLDARSIFYLGQGASAVNAFAEPSVQPSGGGGAAPPPARSVGSQALTGAPAQQLGVRASILRGDQEVDLSTELKSGEGVRLKIVPNADGYLRVTESGRTVASATVQRFKPFETPPIIMEGASPKQLLMTFSRTPLPNLVSLDAASRGNLVEPKADDGRATYVVSAAQQIVVPVTLTFR